MIIYTSQLPVVIGRLLIVIVAFSVTALFADEAAKTGVESLSLDKLLEQLPKVASDGRGMNAEEQNFAEALAKYGAAAVDPLIAFLGSEDPEIYQLVTYCLVELKKGDFKPKHLEPMARAARKKRDWLPNAIANIDTVEAAEFLAKDFRRFPQTMAQIDNALERMAPRSIAPLLTEFRNATEDEVEFLKGLASVFRDCGSRASSAVEPLAAIALESDQPLFRRQAAIQYLGAIGPPSRKTFPELRGLAAKDPEHFAYSVKQAIADSRTPDAADLLIDNAIAQARDTGETYLFRDIATEVGPAGKHLTDQLVGLLDDPNPNVRLGACRTLGYLGEPNVWPHLSRMLKEQDWRVAYAAALSLTQLGAKASRPALEDCRKNHWYPRVRYAADYALRRLAGGQENETDSKRLGSTFNMDLESAFSSYNDQDELLHPLDDLSDLGIPARQKDTKPTLYFILPENLEKLQALDFKFRSLQTNHPNIYRAILEGVPEVVEEWKNVGGIFGPRVIALEQDGATSVVVISAGQWHGGVFVIEEGKKAKWIFKDFTKAFFRWNGDLVVLSGMTHMGMDYGAVHRIVRNGEEWEAQFLYALPGCPRYGCVLPDGRLFANCMGGGVAITTEGEFDYLGSGN